MLFATLPINATFCSITTDSRSFLSFPRHEYFRRIFCNLIGLDVESGEIPADIDLQISRKVIDFIKRNLS